jgi:hypothetical protein
MNDHKIIVMSVESYRKHGPADPMTVRIIESHGTDRIAGKDQDPSRNQTKAYEEKVRLVNAKRYLMSYFPMTPVT